MQHSNGQHHGNGIIAQAGKWRVRRMPANVEYLKSLWLAMSACRTLFSDITRGNVNNFYQLIASPDAMWFEVVDDVDTLVGIMYITGILNVVDCDVHLIILDKRPAEKLPVIKATVAHLFDTLPLHRMTATIPRIYRATWRLAKKIGFVEEGCKRESLLMDGRWCDEIILGLRYEDFLNGKHN